MRLLVNHQLIQIAMQSKSISLEKIGYKRSQGIAVTSLHSSFFDVKNKDKNESRKIVTNVVLALKFLWTAKFTFP